MRYIRMGHLLMRYGAGQDKHTDLQPFYSQLAFNTFSLLPPAPLLLSQTTLIPALTLSLALPLLIP